MFTVEQGIYKSKVVMEGIFVVFAMIGLIIALAAVGKIFAGSPKAIGAKSAKFPPPFSSSLNRNEILTAVEARVTNIASLRQKWKTTEKVEKVGRYQAMLNVPFNLNGDNIRVSFLLNLLATSKEAGGCTVEWNYVMMSPFNIEPLGLSVIAEDIYKNTTLEIRSALFIAQGDEEEASFLDSQTQTTNSAQEKPSALEILTRQAAKAQDSEEDRPSPETKLDNYQPSALPDIVGEELKHIPGTTGDPSLMQIPDVSAQMPVTVPPHEEDINTLNFSPRDPLASSSGPKSAEAKCIKCSQDRDPSFNFCLYCGHAD